MLKKQINISKELEDNGLSLAEKLKNEFFSLPKIKREDKIKEFLELIVEISGHSDDCYRNNVKLKINNYKLFNYLLNNGIDNWINDLLLDDFHRLVHAKNNNEPIRYSNNNYYKDIKEKYNTFEFDELLNGHVIDNLKSFEEIRSVIKNDSDIFKKVKENFIGKYCIVTVIVDYLPEKYRDIPERPLMIDVITDPMFSDLTFDLSESIEPYISADRISDSNLFFYTIANCMIMKKLGSSK